MFGASPAAGALRPRQPPPFGSSSLPGEDACACYRAGTLPCASPGLSLRTLRRVSLRYERSRVHRDTRPKPGAMPQPAWSWRMPGQDPNPRGRAPKRRPPLAHLTEGQSQSGIPPAGSSCALPASSDPGSQQRHPRGRRKTRLQHSIPTHIRWRRVSRDGTRRDAQWGKGGAPFRSSTESCCRSEVRDDITVSGRSEAGAWAGRVAKL